MMQMMKQLTRKIKQVWNSPFKEQVRIIREMSSRQEVQHLLIHKYRELAERQKPLPPLADAEFSCYSTQAGIYLYVLGIIGMKNRITVEICAGDGIHCSSGNLIVNHDYKGLLIDGSSEILGAGSVYKSFNWIHPPTVKQAWVTRDNVNELITSSGFSEMYPAGKIRGEVDVLTLDMDGVDYWIWEAIDGINPRLFVCEYQTCWGPEISVTVPYRDEFVGSFHKGIVSYGGASLSAFVKLCRRKGYRLIGCDRYCYNAYFLREDVGQEHFPEVPTEVCFGHFHADFCRDEILPIVKDMDWENV